MAFLDGDFLMMYTFCSLFVLHEYVLYNLSDYNNRNQFLTAEILHQGYQYHKLYKAYLKSAAYYQELIVDIMLV